MRCLVALFLCFIVASPLLSQKQKREPLTDAQVEKIAEAGIDPDARVALYNQFLKEKADAIKALGKRASSDARSSRLSDALEDFAALMDELGDNLDVYSDRKADIRKALEPNLCRCGTHMRILRAVGRAAQLMKVKA